MLAGWPPFCSGPCPGWFGLAGWPLRSGVFIRDSPVTLDLASIASLNSSNKILYAFAASSTLFLPSGSEPWRSDSSHMRRRVLIFHASFSSSLASSPGLDPSWFSTFSIISWIPSIWNHALLTSLLSPELSAASFTSLIACIIAGSPLIARYMNSRTSLSCSWPESLSSSRTGGNFSGILLTLFFGLLK